MKIIMAIFLLLVSVTASAQMYSSEVTINSIKPFAGTYPDYPTLADVSRLYFNATSLGGCRGDAADLHKNDAHLLSILLTAWAIGQRIEISVDDSLPKAHSTVCRIVSIRTYK